MSRPYACLLVCLPNFLLERPYGEGPIYHICTASSIPFLISGTHSGRSFLLYLVIPGPPIRVLELSPSSRALSLHNLLRSSYRLSRPRLRSTLPALRPRIPRPRLRPPLPGRRAALPLPMRQCLPQRVPRPKALPPHNRLTCPAQGVPARPIAAPRPPSEAPPSHARANAWKRARNPRSRRAPGGRCSDPSPAREGLGEG